jgi:prepilin-type processing-associated H-X9-DG protein
MNPRKASSGKSVGGLLMVIALVGAVAFAAVQKRMLGELRRENEQIRAASAENEGLQSQRQEIERLRVDNQQLERLRRDNQELHRLRGEVRQLREQSKMIDQLQADNLLLREEGERLQRTQAQAAAQQQDQQQSAALAELQAAKNEMLRRVGISRQIGVALIQHAQNHQDQLPTDLTQLRDSVGEGESGKVDLRAYEILAAGKLAEIPEPTKTAVVREKQKDARGLRVYVFADGHVELKKEDE